MSSFLYNGVFGGNAVISKFAETGLAMNAFKAIQKDRKVSLAEAVRSVYDEMDEGKTIAPHLVWALYQK